MMGMGMDTSINLHGLDSGGCGLDSFWLGCNGFIPAVVVLKSCAFSLGVLEEWELKFGGWQVACCSRGPFGVLYFVSLGNNKALRHASGFRVLDLW